MERSGLVALDYAGGWGRTIRAGWVGPGLAALALLSVAALLIQAGRSM